MKVIKTVPFQTSMLTSTNATESVANWAVGTTYAKDAEVNYANSIYVSLQASNLGKQPNLEPTWWIRKSANNTYSMFDEFVNSQTVGTSPLVVEIQPGEIVNSIAFFNLTGVTDISIEIRDSPGGTVVLDETYNLDDTTILDWSMYFFEPYDLRTDFVLQNIPMYPNAVIKCTFTSTSSVSVGTIVFGNVYQIGKTQYGVTAGIRDYSTKSASAFGITTFTQRAFSKRMEANVYVNNADLRFVQKLLQDLRATPTVWIGSDAAGYDILSIYGYYRDFNIEIPYPNNSFCRLEIEGLI